MNFINIIQDDKILNTIHRQCVNKKIDAYIVGGFVRDLLLKVESKDVDIVVVGQNGIDFAHMCAKALKFNRKNVKFFKNFGTANFTINGTELEFVGARKESYRRDSRKPLVEDGTLQDDQERRDFTFNAMSIDLKTGELIDPFNGLQDLKDGIIKTPVDANITFSDDPLRQLRAVRFAARFKFVIDPSTFQAIKLNISRLDIVSSERIIGELNKLLLSKYPEYGIKLMEECGLLSKILPEVVALKGVEKINNFKHKDNFVHTLQVLKQTADVSNDITLRWTALLHDIGKAKVKSLKTDSGWTFHNHELVGSYMAKKIATRLKFGPAITNKLILLIERHGHPKELVKDIVTDSAIRRFVVEMGDTMSDLLLFATCDITTKFKDKKDIQISKLLTLFDRIKEIEESDNLKNFKVPISGAEIMKIFDLTPCKKVGLIKSFVKEAVLNGECKNDEWAARKFVDTNFNILNSL